MLIAFIERLIGGLERKISKLLVKRPIHCRIKEEDLKIARCEKRPIQNEDRTEQDLSVAYNCWSKDCMVRFASAMSLCRPDNKQRSTPAPVAQWLARQTVGRKVWGSNPIRVMWDFSALAGSYPVGRLEPHSRASSTSRMRL